MPLTPQNVDLISQGANSIFGIASDLINRKYNRKMYEKQRADALADWNMQNEYNSPAAQMKRLKEAGLNPNLVYGDGGATMAAPPIKSSDMALSGISPKNIDLGRNQMMGYDIKIKEAQLKNLQASTTTQEMDTLLREAQIEATYANAGLTKWKTQSSRGLYPHELQNIQSRNEAILANTTFTKQQTQINRELADMNLSKGFTEQIVMRVNMAKTRQEIENMKETLNLLRKEGILKDFEIQLNKTGATKGDSYIIRNLPGFLQTLGFQSPSVVLENAKKLLKKATDYLPGVNQFYNENKK